MPSRYYPTRYRIVGQQPNEVYYRHQQPVYQQYSRSYIQGYPHSGMEIAGASTRNRLRRNQQSESVASGLIIFAIIVFICICPSNVAVQEYSGHAETPPVKSFSPDSANLWRNSLIMFILIWAIVFCILKGTAMSGFSDNAVCSLSGGIGSLIFSFPGEGTALLWSLGLGIFFGYYLFSIVSLIKNTLLEILKNTKSAFKRTIKGAAFGFMIGWLFFIPEIVMIIGAFVGFKARR